MTVINQENLTKSEIIIKNIFSEENCYYRVASLFIFGVEDYYNLIR